MGCHQARSSFGWRERIAVERTASAIYGATRHSSVVGAFLSHPNAAGFGPQFWTARSFSKFGGLGVDIFFVLSGFVLSLCDFPANMNTVLFLCTGNYYRSQFCRRAVQSSRSASHARLASAITWSRRGERRRGYGPYLADCIARPQRAGDSCARCRSIPATMRSQRLGRRPLHCCRQRIGIGPLCKSGSQIGSVCRTTGICTTLTKLRRQRC
jgi:hypothetical protein